MPVSLSDMKARLSPDQRAQVEQQAAQIIAEAKGLQALRMARASTQVELACRLHVSQASVAQLERRADILLSTLREYVEALGGHLDLVASFDDGAEPLRITGLADIGVLKGAKSVSRRGHRSTPRRPAHKAASRRESETPQDQTTELV